VSTRRLGVWSGGRFYFKSGHSLPEAHFVCPYGCGQLIAIDEDSELAYGDYHEGDCRACRRRVSIDYRPEAILAPGTAPPGAGVTVSAARADYTMPARSRIEQATPEQLARLAKAPDA
jgi:hypothetical protein